MKRLLLLPIVWGIFLSSYAGPTVMKAQEQAIQPIAPTVATIAPAAAALPPNTSAQPLVVPTPPSLPDTSSYVLMDATSGKILAQKNMDQKLPPASLTKLMTIYITEETLNNGQTHLTDQVRVSENAWKASGSRLFLKLGSEVPLQTLLEGVIVASGNDACVALAEYIAGNEDSFANLMNQTADRLGMTNTHFMDSTGLPNPNHYSTAHDLALLARHIIVDFPQYYSFFQEKWITFNGIKQPNRNRLLWRDSSVDGLKTGHTDEAGFCLVASGIQHGTRLISVVMGTPSDSARSDDSQALLNWGFRFYTTHKLYSAGQVIVSPRVYLGVTPTVPMGVQQDMYVTLPIGALSSLKTTMDTPMHLKAPIVKGQAYGTLTVTLAGEPIGSAPIVALDQDPVGSIWARMADHLALMLKL